MAKTLSLATSSQLCGSNIVQELGPLTRTARELRVVDLVLAGNVPVATRTLVDVPIEFRDTLGRPRNVVLSVSSDYLAVGTDADSVRMPLSPIAAQHIADALGCMLPTTRIVDLIWKAARTLAPAPWGPPYDASMLSVARFAAHSARVDAQQAAAGVIPGELVGGTKKDVVLANRLLVKPASVAIYGWHRANSVPIQPLSLVHEDSYADYSHGFRLVLKTCVLDGIEDVSLSNVLKDPVLTHGLSTEGPLRVFRQPRA